MWPQDPYRNSFFVLEIGGIWEAEFSECTGIASENEVVQIEEGGENLFAHKMRGRNKYPNIVLKHGISRMSPALWAWREAMIHRTIPPLVDGAVILFDDQKNEVVRWIFKNGGPVKWKGPTLSTREDKLAIEVLEIAHDGLMVQIKGSLNPPTDPVKPSSTGSGAPKPTGSGTGTGKTGSGTGTGKTGSGTGTGKTGSGTGTGKTGSGSGSGTGTGKTGSGSGTGTGKTGSGSGSGTGTGKTGSGTGTGTGKTGSGSGSGSGTGTGKTGSGSGSGTGTGKTGSGTGTGTGKTGSGTGTGTGKTGSGTGTGKTGSGTGKTGSGTGTGPGGNSKNGPNPPVQFAFDSTNPTAKKNFDEALEKVAAFLKKNPDTWLVVEGHTCSIGSASYNKKLSVDRAETTRDHLVKDHGVPKKKIKTVGYGEEFPGYWKPSTENPKNRRPEFYYTSPEWTDYDAPSKPKDRKKD